MFHKFKELLMLLYGVPLLIAHNRQHPHDEHICKLNIYLGWTVIGWLVALAWALWWPRRRDWRGAGDARRGKSDGNRSDS